MDDDDAHGWHGPRFSNTNGVLGRVHERSCTRSGGLQSADQERADWKPPLLGYPKIVRPLTNAFGHPGAGGSHAFADPENKISFAYVMNQMEQSLLPNEKSLRLVDAIYRCAD